MQHTAQPMLTREIYEQDMETWYLMHEGELLTGYVKVLDGDDEIDVSEIGVHPEHRRQGLASTLLKTVLADYPDAPIVASLQPFVAQMEHWPFASPGLSLEELKAWFTRLGFQHAPNDIEYDRMRRLP
ncbi:GNAT family N-acetyltransferase [Streptomyces sp. NPDC005803]|uniref:GNAT family N-acetyltransferase n=1 Tax=Streptomyces sp. NPDC005803 TaxID=3154297 RepID=UPI0033CC21C1